MNRIKYISTWLKDRKIFGISSQEQYDVIKEHDFALISQYSNLIDSKLLISNRTWKDLNMNEIFKYIDNTSSKTGEQILYNKLKKDTSEVDYNKFHSKVQYYINNREERIKNSNYLKKYNKGSTYNFPNLLFNKISLSVPKPLYLLSLASFVLMLMLFIDANFFLIFLLLGIINTIIHYYLKRNILIYFSEFRNIIALNRFYYKILENDNIKDSLNTEEKVKLKKLARISFWLSMSVDVTNEFASILFSVIEISKAFFLFDVLLFNRSVHFINEQIPTLLKVYSYMGEVDAAISVAILKTETRKFAEPDFGNTKAIEIKNVYHPLITNCQVNSLVTNENCIITGGNMSGKTSFLKIVALNALLAQTINFTFSDMYKAPRFKIHTSIINEDSISEGKSFFMDELLIIKNIILDIEQSNSYHLIIIDEIFRGTNSKDRIALASSILQFLSRENCFVFVSTHDLEIVSLVKQSYAPYYFDNQFCDDKIIFDYHIKKGYQQNTNVVELLQTLAFPPSIISNTISNRNNRTH